MRTPNLSGRQRGQILPIFCLMLATLLLPVTGLAVDGGLLLTSHATLVGTAQAAAEAAAQAVDVTAIQDHRPFQLCAAPDGGASCGNGIGTVGEVVAEVISANFSSAPLRCKSVDRGFLMVSLGQASGCAFQVVSNCAPVGLLALPPDGVRVVVWQTIQLPLLVFPGWSRVQLRGSATAWMEHGFAPQIAAVGRGGTQC